MKKTSDVSEILRRCKRLAIKKYDATNLHPEQRRIIKLLAKGKDVMGLLPTSRGKSLIFQTYARATRTTSLVITPLKALMRDQVMRARERGYKAAYIASGDSESDDAIEKLEDGELDLLYVSPERLRGKPFLRSVRRANIGLIAVDECHCIISWSERLRPAYGYIGEFVDKLKHRPPLLALTATATAEDCRVIATKLHMKPKYRRVIADPVRDNISYQVLHGNNWSLVKSRALTWRNQNFPGRYIVYCGSRKATELVAASLNEPGFICMAYHAGLDEKTRKNIEKGFAEKRFPVIASTNAFGMGVDIPDIREIVHLGPPQSIEAYTQESGRGGRDGKPCLATMLFDEKGVAMVKRLIETGVPNEVKLETVWEFLCEKVKDADDVYETSDYDLFTEIKPILDNISPYDIEPILLTLDAMGAIIYRNAESSSALSVNCAELRQGLSKLTENVRRVAQEILKALPENVPTASIHFDAESLAQKSGLPQRFVKRAVIALDVEHDLLTVQKKYNRALITMKKWGLPATKVIDYKAREAYLSRLTGRLRCVVEFAYADDHKAYIRKYFGYAPKTE